MKKSVVLPALLLWLFAIACEPENSSNKVAEEQNEKKFDSTAIKEDAAFAVNVASSFWLEIEMGKFASKTASSADVKAFGQTMAAIHDKGIEQLKNLATKKDISLPSVPDNDKQNRMDDLKKKKGAEFDREYIAMMIKAHSDDIEVFQKELEKGNDTALKTWAKDLLPVLQNHLHMAEELQKGLKK